MSIMDNVQPAVKKETGKVAAITGIGLILMWIVFGVLHAFMPQKVPFDYTVFLGGAVGGCVAVLNFFFMGLAVQKAAAATDEDTARMRIKASYSQRMLIQMFTAFFDADPVGDPGNRGTLFSFCGRNRSSFISRNRN